METSILLAKLIGVIMLAIGLGMLLDKKHYMSMIRNVVKDSAFIFLSGTLSLLVGLVIVLYHNVWVQSWEVLITLFGWAAILKGLARIVFPSHAMAKIQNMVKNEGLMNAAMIGCIIIGAVLSYYGFMAY